MMGELYNWDPNRALHAYNLLKTGSSDKAYKLLKGIVDERGGPEAWTNTGLLYYFARACLASAMDMQAEVDDSIQWERAKGNHGGAINLKVHFVAVKARLEEGFTALSTVIEMDPNFVKAKDLYKVFSMVSDDNRHMDNRVKEDGVEFHRVEVVDPKIFRREVKQL